MDTLGLSLALRTLQIATQALRTHLFHKWLHHSMTSILCTFYIRGLKQVCVEAQRSERLSFRGVWQTSWRQWRLSVIWRVKRFVFCQAAAQKVKEHRAWSRLFEVLTREEAVGLGLGKEELFQRGRITPLRWQVTYKRGWSNQGF